VSSSRQLGWISAVALVVASMIGTGVFTTSGFLLADLKSPWLVLAAWFIGGILAALGALRAFSTWFVSRRDRFSNILKLGKCLGIMP